MFILQMLSVVLLGKLRGGQGSEKRTNSWGEVQSTGFKSGADDRKVVFDQPGQGLAGTSGVTFDPPDQVVVES